MPDKTIIIEENHMNTEGYEEFYPFDENADYLETIESRIRRFVSETKNKVVQKIRNIMQKILLQIRSVFDRK